MTTPRVIPVVERLLASAPCSHRAHFRFAGYPITVESNHERVIEDLVDYYQEFRADPDPDAITVSAIEAEPPDLSEFDLQVQAREPGKSLKEKFADLPDGRIVKKVRTGMVFLFGAHHHVAVGPAHDNLAQVVNFINNRFMHWVLDQGAVLGHCAAIVHEGKALALAGFSGMGKSTLALHAMGADDTLGFLSNDRIMFARRTEAPGVHVWGVPKHPRINPGTALNNPRLTRIMSEEERAQFSRYAPEQLWEVEHKYDALVHVCFGPRRFPLQAQLVGLGILNWRRDGGALAIDRVDLAQRRDLLPAVMKSPGVFYTSEPGEPRVEFGEDRYVRELEGVSVLEFAGGVDFEAATRVCLDFLREADDG